MIVKRNFSLIKIFGYIRTEFLVSVGVSSVAFGVLFSQDRPLSLPFSVAAILGTALAIFIGFRNNTAYARWWEARTAWANITHASRILARLVYTFTDAHRHQQNYEADRSARFKREMIYRQIAWVHALRLQLRNQSTWEELRPLLPADEYEEVVARHHKPNALHLIMGRHLYEAMANGTLGGFDSFQIEGQLGALASYQGVCERIKKTPLLRQYDYFTRAFLYVFILMLPWCLVGDFARLEAPALLIPVSVILATIFSIINKVGEVNEDPFEHRITDVPLLALCTTIERDLREMLGEQELPALAVPHAGYLF